MANAWDLYKAKTYSNPTHTQVSGGAEAWEATKKNATRPVEKTKKPITTLPTLKTSGGTSSTGSFDALWALPQKAKDIVKNTDRQALLDRRNILESRRESLRSANVGGVGTFSHANDSNATRIRELDDEIASVDRFLDLQNQIELQPYEQKVTPAREALSKHSIQTNFARRSRDLTYEESKQAAKKADELRREVEKKQRGVEGIKYKQNYQDITQDSSFAGQFSANYDIGQMGEDEALAWNTYLNDPTEENRIYAESVSAAREAYMARNQEALEADTGNSWISKDLAGYLPQFLGQNIAGIKGGIGGGAVGTVVPVFGTATGLKAGYTAGRALYGYETARGRVFKALLDAGVPEDQARLAANDEAIVSSIIEGGDAVIDMITLGFGNLLKKGGTAAAKSTLPKILRNYGINVGSEGLQEWTQEGVSIANQNRNDTGILNLVQESAGQMGRAISGQDPEALEQMNQAGLTGLKIAAMMGGGGIAFNTALSKATSPLMLPTADQAQETGYSKITEQDAINRFNQNVNNRTVFEPNNTPYNFASSVSGKNSDFVEVHNQSNQNNQKITIEESQQPFWSKYLVAPKTYGTNPGLEARNTAIYTAENVDFSSLPYAEQESFLQAYDIGRSGEKFLDEMGKLPVQSDAVYGAYFQGQDDYFTGRDDRYIQYRDKKVNAEPFVQKGTSQPASNVFEQRRQGVQIPVQERTWQDAGNRKVNAFQYDHPELRPYYAEAARALKYDLASSTKGERFPIFDANSKSGKDIIGYTGTKRSVTEPIAQALDNANLSYAQIDKAIDDLIADNGQENYAAAKKLELVLDDMLTNGYTDSDGYTVPPNQEYIAARDNVNAGFSADNAEYRMSEAEFNAAVARDPAAAQLAEQLSKSFYAGDITQEEYSGAMDLMKAQLLPTVESLPTVGPESSVGAARKGFDPYSAFLGTKSEFFPEGANAARPVDVPTTDAEGNPIRKTAATAMGAKAIPDEVVGDIQNMVMSGDLSYKRVTDRDSINRAISRIKADGFQRALGDFSDAVQKGVVSKDMATLGQQLLVNAANAGDSNATAEILSLYAQMETVAGQAVQAASIFRKLSPTAQLYAAQKAVDGLNNSINEKKSGSRTKKIAPDGTSGGKLSKPESDELIKSLEDERDTAVALVSDILSSMGKKRKSDFKEIIDRLPTSQKGVNKYLERIDKFINNERADSWVNRLGQDLAKRASNRVDPQPVDETIYKTVLSDLSKFMTNYVDAKRLPVKKRTAASRMADFFNNRSEYSRAWRVAQDSLRAKYAGDQKMLDRLEDFLQNGIAYNAVGPDSVMMQAVADSALREDVSIQELVVRQKYDIDDLVSKISSDLINETGASGSDVIVIQDAVRRYVNEKAMDGKKTSGEYITSGIRKSMEEIGVKVSDIIKTGKGNKKAVGKSIADMLVKEYKISKNAASEFSDDVIAQFDAILEDASRRKLDQIFKDRPEYVKKTVEQTFTELANMGAFYDSNFSKKATEKVFGYSDITIPKNLVEKFLQQTDQDGRDNVMKEIYKSIGKQVPSTWRDKWNAWRYLAMLGNPRTHIRNIVGNVGFQPVRWTKDRLAAAIEAGVSAASGGKLQRTKSFATNPALYRAAWQDYKNVSDVLSGNKYDDVQSIINDNRTIFKTKPLEALRKFNTNALSVEDMWFKRITYAGALSGYLNANGVTAEQLKSGNVDPNLLSAARDYAGQDALKATYNDRNVVSDKVIQAARALGPFGEAVLPFKRTPANILVRGFEYSPLGLAKGLTYDLYQVKQGNMTGAQAIDNIAAGMTGTGLMLLGGLLAAAGIVSGGAGDDEKQAQFNELTGGQTYALNLPGGGSVTLDWLAPEALPFFMGVQAMESFGEEGLTGDTITSAFASISEPMLEMSMLQSLNDLIDNVSYAASNEKLSGLVGSSLISYLTQAIPTIGGQIERTFEDKRYSTYTNKDSLLPTDIQYALGKASAKIPGWDFQQVPYIDAWGREEETGLLPMRALNNFLNPAYTSSLNVTPVDEEIQRLYNATGVGSVIPSRADKSITVDGEDINLSGDKYVEYAKTKGGTAFDLLSSIIDTSAYKGLSDDEKVKLISDVYEYANSVGKAAVSSYKPEGFSAKVQSTGVDPADYILYRSTADADNNGTVTQSEAASALLPMKNLSNAEKGKVWQSQNSSWNEKKNPFSGALASAGIDASTATSILNKYSEVYNMDIEPGEQAAELSKFLDGLNLTADQRTVVDDTYKFYNMFPATIKAYNIETMSKSAKEKWPRVQAWGMSEKDYLKYYPMVSSGKKADCLQKLEDAGMTQAQANYFWSLVKSK